DFDGIPGNAATADHGLDLGHFTVVFTRHQTGTAAFLPGFVERGDLCVLVGSAKRDDGEVIGLSQPGGEDTDGQSGELEDLDHCCYLQKAGMAGKPSCAPPGRRLSGLDSWFCSGSSPAQKKGMTVVGHALFLR